MSLPTNCAEVTINAFVNEVNRTDSSGETWQNFIWSFSMPFPQPAASSGNFMPTTLPIVNGNSIALQTNDKYKINFALLNGDLEIIYVNLSSSTCATHEIIGFFLDKESNTISLYDANSNSNTGSAPIGFQLIARKNGTATLPITSPDPDMENNPSNTD